jgi:hypothetical protein
MPFPNTINITQAVGVPGDFASYNPRHSVPSTQGGWVAGINGVAVGLFAWADPATETVVNNYGQGVPTGLIHRNMQVLLVTYLTEYGVTIPAGMGVGELFSGGDFFVKNAADSAVTVGQKAFANFGNGTIAFAATGATIAGATLTGTVSTTVLTVSAQSVNPILVGDLVIGLSPATYIASFGTGTGGTGTYNLTTSGATGTATGTTIWVETKWNALSFGAAGETIIISNTPNG